MPSVRPQTSEGKGTLRPKLLRSSHPQSDDVPALLAHDLKTPLAAIAMNLDFALAELDSTSSTVRAALEDSLLANARAVRLVSDMADAVRLTTGDRAPSMADAALASLVEAGVARVARDAEMRGARILWASGNEVMRVDAQLLERAVERLVERALRQAVTGVVVVDQRAGVITVRTEVSAERAFGDRCLATLFADAVARSMGGRFSIDEADGTLVYRMSLVAP